MRGTRWHPRRRLWPWLVGFVALGLAAALFVWQIVLRDTTTPVPVAKAVDSFRATDDAPASTAATEAATDVAALPAAGVYLYATLGGEEVDALGGTRHDYPTTTTVTVTGGGCGVVLRWDALEERSEELELCRRDGSLVVPRYTSFHRFFSQDDSRPYRCDEPIVLVPADPLAGTTMTSRCQADDLIEDITVTVVGAEPVDIEDGTVDAIHVRLATELGTDDDSTTGDATSDLWLAMDGTVLRWTEQTRTTADSLVGDVHYDESFELELSALEPVR
ncbi:MAG: hypothetical protein OEU32_03840 [Acidimicrobiia bacterium]|nr:hypothetical protein [Acidimicrobiia bacterium]